MANQQLIQKKYYQLIMPGHYLDVRFDQTNWKIAKVVDKDKRYLYVSFDGYHNQEEQIFINSYRVAPLRLNTQGYTGSSLKLYRNIIPKISQLKNYLEIANQKFFDQQKANAFQITQLLRGQLFVYVHDLLCKQAYLSPVDIKQTNSFFINFVDLILKIAQKSLKYTPEYFATSSAIKLQYLVNAKVALLSSLQQLLILLNFVLRVDTNKLMYLYKLNKQQVDPQVFLNYFKQKKGMKIMSQIFHLTDGNGKWYPSSIRKSIFKMMLKFDEVILPKYGLKDYQEFFSIYPFMIQFKSSQTLQKEYIEFAVNLLLQNSPFDSKMRAIQQLRKILQGNFRLQFYQQQKILDVIINRGVVDFLLQQKNFNPQIFKRFVPILNVICKVKSLSLKHINSLFKIIEHRHQSQTQIIFQIICKITQFAPSALLDNIYSQILKIDINNQQTIKFIKNFSIKAIQNLSKQKSGLMAWFSRKKVSSKHGYYGLALLYSESLDSGILSKDKVIFTLQTLKQIMGNENFHGERQIYIQNCINSLSKKKNLGQSIKLLSNIIGTYEQYSMLSEDQRKVVQKLDTKFNLLNIILDSFKNKQKLVFEKISFEDFQKYFYQFLQSFGQYLKNQLNVNQIQFLWRMKDNQQLFQYLKKSKNKQQKYKKAIGSQKIQEILKEIISKNSFYKRVLSLKQFQVLNQLFVSYHLEKRNLFFSNKQGLLRFSKINLLGYNLYLQFASNVQDQKIFQKVIQKGLQIILRPYEQMSSQKRANVWKRYFNEYFQKLKKSPKKCLIFVQLFFTLIEGRLYKQISLVDQSYTQILVKYLSNQSKISLQRNSTIFRLRKMIAAKFQIKNDFAMFNVKMNKNISFQQQEDFSVNAMPAVDKGPSIVVQFGDKQIHYHEQCVKIFKGLVQNDQQFYEQIFKLGQEPNVQIMFWRLVQSLPINKTMLNKVEKCQKFIKKNWSQFFDTQYDDSLQYKLNIILALIKKSDTWATKMFDTKGLQVIIEIFLNKIQDGQQQEINSALVQKLLTIILHCYELCDRKLLGEQMLSKMNLSIVNLIENQFNQIEAIKQAQIQTIKQAQDIKELINEDKKQIKSETKLLSKQKKDQQQPVSKREAIIGLNLLNKLLDLYLRNSKYISKLQVSQRSLSLQTFICVLYFGLFQKKSEASNKFSQEISVSVTFTLFQALQMRTFILQNLMKKINLSFFQEHPNCQNFFKYLITVLHTFTKQDQQKQEAKCFNYHFQTLLKFILTVINSQIKDSSPTQSNKILNGALKIMQFILSKIQEKQFNYQQIFKSIVQNFLFNEDPNKNTKRIKTQKNKKILYQILKKMCFVNSNLVNILIEKIQGFLQCNQWRKNNMLNWNIHLQKSDKKIFCGLQNLGATCYMNCLFQQLFMIKEFRDKFLSINSKVYKQKSEQNEIQQLQNVFSQLKYSNRKSVNTKKFCDSFISYQGTCINPMIQSDADQFFNSLMEKIQTFLKFFDGHKILEDTFQGKLSNQLICQGCPHRSQKFDNFLSIGVNLKNKKSLQQALKGYVQGQILDGDNAYFCQQCQKKVRTMKRLCIKQLPNILVIVIKRFQFNYDELKKIKINSYLQFPQKLNMEQYLSDYLAKKQNNQQPMQLQNARENFNFRLRGSVIHAGTSEAGHYYSFIKEKGKWYEFNDQTIQQITYKKVQEDGFGGQEKSSDEFKMQKFKNAYILFYEKQSYAVAKDNSKIYQPIQSQFSLQLKKKIITDNYNANLFSVLLDANFIRLWENFSILQNKKIIQFLFLYFHTAILRDKFRFEYAPNYFRILMNLLDKNQNCQWFLNQITKSYIRQFLIQAPKIVRHLCISFVIKVLRRVQKIPNQIIQRFLCSIRRHGMTPFAKVFRIFSKKQEGLKFLLQRQYNKLMLNILLDDKFQVQLKPFLNEQRQQKDRSYFGCDSSDHQLQKQKCSAALVESLFDFQVLEQDIFKLNQKYSSREANKTIAHLLIKTYKRIQGQDVKAKVKQLIAHHVAKYQQAIVKVDFRKDQIEKYIFYLRELGKINQCQQEIPIIIQSLKKFIANSQNLYDATQYILRQINKMAVRNQNFCNKWKQNVKKDEFFQKILRYWLKEAQKPHFMANNEEYKRKVSNMSHPQRQVYKRQNSELLQIRFRWMLETVIQKQKLSQHYCQDIVDYSSDLQEQIDKQITIRNKTVIIRQKFKDSTICRVQCEKVQRWAILQRNDLELYNNL